jgi:ABC-2 type transport system permease protein
MRDRTLLLNSILAPIFMVGIFGVVLSLPAFSGGSAKLTAFAPGLISMVAVIVPMEAVTGVSAMYKKTKIFKQLSLTPLSRVEWLSSKSIWFIIVDSISFVPSYLTAVIFFGAQITLTPWIIPLLALGTVFFTALGMIVGTLAKSPETANTITYILTVPMLFLTGAIFPVAFMPTYLQDIARILPQYYVVEGLNAVMIYSDYWLATKDIVVCSALTLIIFLAATGLCKWRED